jgi:hypothetical protein
MSAAEKKIHTKPVTSISSYLAEFDILHYSLVDTEKNIPTKYAVMLFYVKYLAWFEILSDCYEEACVLRYNAK